MSQKKVFKIVIVSIFFILLLAPWMTNDWCKNKLIGYQFNGYRPVDDSWNITIDVWLPFGRYLGVWLPKEEQPQKPEDFPENEIYLPAPGGYGFMAFMTFWGKVCLTVGR